MGQLFLRQMQTDAGFAAVVQGRHPIAAGQMQQLLGQAGTQGQGVEVLDQAKQLANATRLQAQQGIVKLDVGGQDFLEIGFGHAQNAGLPMGVPIVGAGIAVQNGHIAKPNPWLHISEGDLFARQRGAADPDRALGTGHPLLGRVATGGDQIAVLESFDVSASKYVVSQ